MSLKKALFVALLPFVLSSCTCNHEGIMDINFMEAQDKLLTCRQLEYAILDTEAKLQLAQKQSERIDIYSKTPLCIMDTDWAVERARQNANARINYLNSLKKQKGCVAQSSGSGTINPPLKPDLQSTQETREHNAELVKLPLS